MKINGIEYTKDEAIAFLRAEGFTEENIRQASDNLAIAFNKIAISMNELAEIASKIPNPFYYLDITSKNLTNPIERQYRNKKKYN